MALFLALWGGWKLRKSPAIYTVVTFLLPGALAYALMQMGGIYQYTNSPRIVAMGYPTILLLGGYALSLLRPLARWLWILFFFSYANADIFGNPWIYYLWYYRVPNPWIFG